MLWEVDIYAAEGQPDLGAREAAAAAAELHLLADISCGAGVPPAGACGAGVPPAGAAATAAPQEALAITSARGFLIQGDLDRGQLERIAGELLADRVVERAVVAPVGDAALARAARRPAAHWSTCCPSRA